MLEKNNKPNYHLSEVYYCQYDYSDDCFHELRTDYISLKPITDKHRAFKFETIKIIDIFTTSEYIKYTDYTIVSNFLSIFNLYKDDLFWYLYNQNIIKKEDSLLLSNIENVRTLCIAMCIRLETFIQLVVDLYNEINK